MYFTQFDIKPYLTDDIYLKYYKKINNFLNIKIKKNITKRYLNMTTINKNFYNELDYMLFKEIKVLLNELNLKRMLFNYKGKFYEYLFYLLNCFGNTTGFHQLNNIKDDFYNPYSNIIGLSLLKTIYSNKNFINSLSNSLIKIRNEKLLNETSYFIEDYNNIYYNDNLSSKEAKIKAIELKKEYFEKFNLDLDNIIINKITILNEKIIEIQKPI